MDMAALLNSLLRTGLSLKLNQIKRAIRSYLHDRTDQAQNAVLSYAVAAALFVLAGIFLIAACLVGIMALFRWIELNYGLFQAYGAVGALLLLVGAICAAIAGTRLRRKPPNFPTLTSRLRVAIRANPVRPDQIDAATDTAAAILLSPPASPPVRRAPAGRRPQLRRDTQVRVALIVTATLLGWAAVRRRQQQRRTVA
jgi:hypothetical protein